MLVQGLSSLTITWTSQSLRSVASRRASEPKMNAPRYLSWNCRRSTVCKAARKRSGNAEKCCDMSRLLLLFVYATSLVSSCHHAPSPGEFSRAFPCKRKLSLSSLEHPNMWWVHAEFWKRELNTWLLLLLFSCE